MNESAMEILLVEDNPADVRLTQIALAEGSIPTRLSVVRDGVEAMAFLRREGGYAESPRPHLVLLDLNLPRMSGSEVLAELKADPILRCIPVVVLSTSESDADIAKCYDLHANCFFAKPKDLDPFIATIHCIEKFWLESVKLPTITAA